MQSLRKTIGKSIRTRRAELGLDLETLNKYSGVTVSVLSNIENGKANPTVNTLEKILVILGITLQTVIIKR